MLCAIFRALNWNRWHTCRPIIIAIILFLFLSFITQWFFQYSQLLLVFIYFKLLFFLLWYIDALVCITMTWSGESLVQTCVYARYTLTCNIPERSYVISVCNPNGLSCGDNKVCRASTCHSYCYAAQDDPQDDICSDGLTCYEQVSFPMH